jgi:FkbM family methyltransferase
VGRKGKPRLADSACGDYGEKMSLSGAKFWDRFLTIYGTATPPHPGKWRIIAALTTLARPAWTSPRRTTYNGIRFELDLTEYMERHIYLQDFDPLETRFLKKQVKPGWIAIDIGANVGYYSLLLSRLVGPDGSVYAFEPESNNWQKLSKTIELNQPTNLRAHKMALADSCKLVSIVRGPSGNSGKTHLGSCLSQDSEMVEQITLDAFVTRNDLKRVDFVKVDIEGCEERFITGGSKTFSRFKPLLLIELNPAALKGFGSSADSLVSRLREFGYQLFALGWSGLSPLGRMPQGGEYYNVVGLINR